MTCDIRCGDACALAREFPSESVDAIVTDPPYGLEFMGKDWDRLDVRQPGPSYPGNARDAPYARATVRHSSAASYGGSKGREMRAWHHAWAVEALRVAKPGGHLLAFGGTRTFHRLTCAIEDAGWEIRDVIMWVYGSGFPKSHNLKGERAGWGTALKPAYEPIILARKPLVGTVAANVEKHGTGALNIDGCRIEGVKGTPASPRRAPQNAAYGDLSNDPGTGSGWDPNTGRWPANLVHDGSDEVLDLFPDSRGQQGNVRGTEPSRTGGEGTNCYGEWGRVPAPKRGDAGSAARFFYCAKASRSERGADNNHPTVKPLALMRWLVRLVTPPGGLILDPFCGSGTTGIAALQEGFRFLGFDSNSEYCELARRRIEAGSMS